MLIWKFFFQRLFAITGTPKRIRDKEIRITTKIKTEIEMITVILLIAFAIVFGTLFAQKKLNLVEKLPNGDLKLNYKPLVFAALTLIVIVLQPYSLKKVEAGYKGLAVNLIGDSRGASAIKEVSGLVLFNSYTQELHEVALDQRNIVYPKSTIIAKGGFPCDIHPTFNYSVKEHTAADMFTNLRSTFKRGGLEAIEQGWLQTAILGAVNDVANRFVIDDIFNNRQQFEAAIVVEANNRVGKWFTISQLKTNIQPPGSIVSSINAKAKAVQDAITSESQAKAATADAQRKIAIAKGDSATVVIKASAEALSLEIKQKKLSPIYIEYMRAQRWDGKLPTTVLGNGGSSIINLK